LTTGGRYFQRPLDVFPGPARQRSVLIHRMLEMAPRIHFGGRDFQPAFEESGLPACCHGNDLGLLTMALSAFSLGRG
jgi:hypothetical protein